jgi:hypothetical protein
MESNHPALPRLNATQSRDIHYLEVSSMNSCKVLELQDLTASVSWRWVIKPDAVES